MKRGSRLNVCCLALLLGAGADVWAEGTDNPYRAIVARNAFNLKPPPPPTDPSATNPPPTPVKVVLTGISTLGGAPKAILEITESAPGKKPEFPPPLVAGDVQGRVEVVSINAEKGEVKIKIDGQEKVLTFEKDGPKAGAAAAAVPAATPPNPLIPRPPGAIPLPTIPTPTPTPAAAAPASSGSYGVLVGGAGTVPGAAPTTPAPAPFGLPIGFQATRSQPGAASSVSVGGATPSGVSVGGATVPSTAPVPAIPGRPATPSPPGSVSVGGATVSPPAPTPPLPPYGRTQTPWPPQPNR